MKVIKELPKDMEGHIIVFEDPLIVYQTKERKQIIKGAGVDGRDVTRVQYRFTGKKAKCFFMRAEGGFGCCKRCSGRMIFGEFFKTIEDVVANKPFSIGNTNCYPTGFIKEL